VVVPSLIVEVVSNVTGHTDLWSSHNEASRRLKMVDCLVIKILSRDHFLKARSMGGEGRGNIYISQHRCTCSFHTNVRIYTYMYIIHVIKMCPGHETTLSQQRESIGIKLDFDIFSPLN
jgi:hypothetical protein